MDISIQFQNGCIATRAEIGISHIDLQTLLLTVPVIFYSSSGDVVYRIEKSQVLDGLPIPNESDQWALVMPEIEKLKG